MAYSVRCARWWRVCERGMIITTLLERAKRLGSAWRRKKRSEKLSSRWSLKRSFWETKRRTKTKKPFLFQKSGKGSGGGTRKIGRFLVLDASEASAPRRVVSASPCKRSVWRGTKPPRAPRVRSTQLIASRFKVGSSEGQYFCTNKDFFGSQTRTNQR